MIKTVAIAGTLMIHASTGGYVTEMLSLNWLSSLFWGSLFRFAVPVFLMCSGALMLDPEKRMTIRRLFSHNLFRLVVAMLVWGMVYKLLAMRGNITIAGILQGMKEVLCFKQEFHLYYLHIMFLVYLLVPILRVITEHAERRQLDYLLGVWLLLAIVYPLLLHFWPFSLISGIPVQYGLNLTYACVGYVIAGYYFKKYTVPSPICAGLFIIGFVLTYGVTVVVSVRQGELYSSFLNGNSIGVCLMSLGLFGFLIQRSYSPAVCRVAEKVSKASFCVYLVHIVFKTVFVSHGIDVTLLPCVVSVPLYALALFGLSYIVYLILKRIPIVNQYLI